MASNTPCKTQPSSTPLKNLLLFASFLTVLYLTVSPNRILTLSTNRISPPYNPPPPQTSLHQVVFGIASSAKYFRRRQQYISKWWDPHQMRGYIFLDRPIGNTNTSDLPSIRISEDTSQFPYTFKGGLRSAIRVARIVSEIVGLNLTDVRWFVFGDDDTVFFRENLLATLAKYDHERWFYVGRSSESVQSNLEHSFDMAFGGGGFALSSPLARVLARVLDSCLVRYAHLYGSDARIFACLAELGVGLTHERGFHQVDLHGDLFGLLSAHPLAPLISLHHLDYVKPIFPNMTQSQALDHLFEAVKVDHARILQQTVCYDPSRSRTISVSWGYAVQVFEGNQLLPDLLSTQQTFIQWKKRNFTSTHFIFNTREIPKDPCKRPAVFFLERVSSGIDGISSNYTRSFFGNCQRSSTKNLEEIRVLSQRLDANIEELRAPRRHCCDVLPSSSDKVIDIGIRNCKIDELISMSQ